MEFLTLDYEMYPVSSREMARFVVLMLARNVRESIGLPSKF
jgi:hypothetical protein